MGATNKKQKDQQTPKIWNLKTIARLIKGIISNAFLKIVVSSNLYVLGLLREFSPYTTPGDFQSCYTQWAWGIWGLEKGKTYSLNGVDSWWFTMVQSKQITLNKQRIHSSIQKRKHDDKF